MHSLILKIALKTLSAATFIILSTSVLNAQAKTHERFIGLHFDFHAAEKDSGIGKDFNAAAIDSFLKIAKPDYIQVDSKGTHGYSSYLTAVGKTAPKIATDILAQFRKITLANNIDLYVHYSSLDDEYEKKLHPQWQRIKADGSKDWLLSFMSGYTDSLMLPQLKEIATKYKVNGVWLDADSYAARLEYNTAMQSRFKMMYGYTPPTNSKDAHYQNWVEFNRKQYKSYFRNYINVLHKTNPDFKVINNYAYSSYMPEQPGVHPDFLSVDVRNVDPFQGAFQARCMASQDIPWDVMSWSIVELPDKSVYIKSISKFEQEAANTIALGGGFETYWFQKRNGSLPRENFKLMTDLINFCKARKEYCFKGKVIPQAGIFYSYNSWQKEPLTNETLYNSYGTSGMREAMEIFIDNQISSDVILQHQLNDKLNSYPLIIVPEWNNLGANVIDKLLKYVNNGGKLIVSGTDAVKAFADKCGVILSGEIKSSFTFNYNNQNSTAETELQKATVKNNAAKSFGTANVENTNYPLATMHKFGKGMIALMYFNLENLYSRQNNQLIKNLFKDVSNSMFTNPVARIINAPEVEQIVSAKNNHLFIHLINMSGKDSSYNTVAPINTFNIQVNYNHNPSSVLLQPGNIKPGYNYSNGTINIKIPGLDVYSIVQID